MNRLALALRALLRPDRVFVDPEDVADLRDRVAALEELQTKREIEWADTRERLLKYLRRIEGSAARERQLEAERAGKPQLPQLLAAKFSRNANGGA